MVSDNTKSAAELVKNSIKTNGINHNDLSDLLDIASHAINQEDDVKWALKVTNYVKKSCEYAIKNHIEIVQMDVLYWKCLKVEAPHLFESFLYYMEKNRRAEKKFYKPREKTLRTVVNDLQALEDCELEFLGISLPPRVGKLLSDDTPILTSNGWKTHGELKVGDRVVNQNGEYVKVQYVFKKNYADRIVTFTDGEQIQCHENHEWIVYDRAFAKERILSTKDIENRCLEYGNKNKRGHRYVFQILEKKPMEGEIKELPIPPYTLGTWLGDGTNRKPRITICDTDVESIVNSVVNDGYNVIHTYKQLGCTAYEFGNLKIDLQKIGLCHSRETKNKYIPDIYFTASKEQRLELLAGLLDTDGTLCKKEHRYQYSTIDEKLVDGIVKLISTFGWRASVVKYDKRESNSGIIGKHDVYRIGFNPTIEIPCRVERKQLKEFSKQRKIAIKSIKKCEKKQGNCIQVDGGVYLAGKTMVPTHNSTLCIFFLAWIIGKRPSSHNAMSGHSGILADRFYIDVFKLTENDEYTFHEIFPELKKPATSSEKNELKYDPVESFATLTCRGIDGTWTGAVDISSDGYLYVDDMVRDRTESLSPKRLENRYQDYLNVLVDRKNDGSRELMVGTRWNILDPLGRVETENKDNPRYRFRRIPALNEHGETNFDYDYGLGFSTKYYTDLKARLDKNEWEAKYQQKPFVREGLLFPEDELRTYNGVLPDGEYMIASACDVAWGGGDNLSMPFGYAFGTDGDIYIPDWIFNKGDKTVTKPLVIAKCLQHKPNKINFEGNNGGHEYADDIDKQLREKGFKTNITSAKASNQISKMAKIIQYAPDIKRRCVFLEEKLRSEEYQKGFDELVTTVQIGKNEHEDGADSLVQMLEIIDYGIQKARVVKSPI